MLETITFSFFAYIIASLVHYLYLVLEDSGHASILCKILLCVAIGLFALSLPVSIPISIINQLKQKRISKLHDKEMLDLYWITKMESMSPDEQCRDAEFFFQKELREDYSFNDLRYDVYKKISFRQ